MIKVGAFEAKTQLSRLLDKVAAGEEVLITRHGRPVARLVAAEQIDRQAAADAVADIKRLAQGTRLDGLTIRDLREAGRR